MMDTLEVGEILLQIKMSFRSVSIVLPYIPHFVQEVYDIN